MNVNYDLMMVGFLTALVIIEGGVLILELIKLKRQDEIKKALKEKYPKLKDLL